MSSPGIGGVRPAHVTHHDVDKEGSISDKNPLKGAMDGAKNKANEFAVKIFNWMEGSRWKAFLIAFLALGLTALYMLVLMPHLGFDFSNPSLGSVTMPIIGGLIAGFGAYAFYCGLVGSKLREKISHQQKVGEALTAILGLGVVAAGAWAIAASGVGHGWGGNGWFYIGIAASLLAASVLAVRAYSKTQEVEVQKESRNLQKQKDKQAEVNKVEMSSLSKAGAAHRAKQALT